MRTFLLALLCSGIVAAQDMPFTVELTSPLSTSTNHKGDPVSAQVVQPEIFKGDIIQGHVTESKSGGKIRGEAVLNLNFDALQHGASTIPISSSITSITNSKGQADVDEEGRVVRKTSNLGKAAAGTGAGALIGGLTHGIKGAAIGAGVGAAASLILIEVAAQGPKVEFGAGSRMGLSVKSRGGPDLASLKPNATVAPQRVAQSSPAAPAAPVTAAAAPASAAAAPTAPAAASNGGDQPQLSAVKIDFVPGERTVFMDDFSDMATDEPPPHWKVRGDAMVLRIGGGIRELAFTKDSELTSQSFKLPRNFTFETTIAPEPKYQSFLKWQFLGAKNDKLIEVTVSSGGGYKNVEVSAWAGELLGQVHPPTDLSKPIALALWMQDGRFRAYVNGERVIDANQVKLTADVDHLVLEGGFSGGIAFRGVRLAESAPDFYTTISSTGRYVTHGIYFDTDSDRLKPESAAVMKAVVHGLEKNANLKLAIEGYTDSTGDAQHNVDLSKRRAEAVRSVLIAQFGVDPGRLTASGLGPAKPVGSNDTAEGRAQNRRVEFVKQ